MEKKSGVSGILQVAVQGSFALIRVSGRATFKQAASLKRFCLQAIDHGCDELVFDMETCCGMDSTFMGVLAGLAIHPPPGKNPPDVTVMNLSPKTHAMLSSLGLERVLACHERNADLPGDLHRRLTQALHLEEMGPADDQDQGMSLNTMLQAHQHLVDVDPDNLVRFRDVITYLDLERCRQDLPVKQEDSLRPPPG